MERYVDKLLEVYNDLQLEIKETEEAVGVGAEEDSVLEMEYEFLQDLKTLIDKVEYFELEIQLGKKLDDKERLEVNKLLGWGYGVGHCIAMLYQHQTAEEYEYSRG